MLFLLLRIQLCLHVYCSWKHGFNSQIICKKFPNSEYTHHFRNVYSNLSLKYSRCVLFCYVLAALIIICLIELEFESCRKQRSKNTFTAALLMKAFAWSDQIAGTVITHLISLISILINWFLTSFKSDCFRYPRDSENTSRAGIAFPVLSLMKGCWSSDFIKTEMEKHINCVPQD